MLITPQYVFIHLPKTGGIWVRNAIRSTGIPCYANDVHVPASDILPVLPGHRSFTVVRDPVTWWRSFWMHVSLHGWPWSVEPFQNIIGCCVWPTYQDFMTKVLNDIPGEYSRLVAQYTDGVSYVGHTEDLVADTRKFLSSFDLPLPDFAGLPPLNVAQYNEAAASTDEIDREIWRTEYQVVSMFYGGT